MVQNPSNPWRTAAGLYVSLAQQKMEVAKKTLFALRSLAPTVYGDKGPFAALGVKRHELALKVAETTVGLWEGRASSENL